MTLVNIDQKIEIWKNRLLDLGKRNRLINYRETKRSTLSINAPGFFDLWDIIVKSESELTFPYYNELKGEAIADEYVKTNQSVKELQKTLRHLRSQAKLAIEEQGINTLYLAFGFLKWDEVCDGTFGGDRSTMSSPLLLVPVSLTVESISSPFVLQMTDDEIVLNPTLIYKMKNDFGLEFQDYDEEQGVKACLSMIQRAVENKGWSVGYEVGLSLFSFLKINMYNDLIENKNTIASNQNVLAIAGDASAVQRVPEELNGFSFDEELKPIDTYQVLDADSSQQEAILFAKKGVSFVLQGPPGTGKSQTITNIIAECLADGKKVLFVSEKMAALDVVHSRLKSSGLDDFCLVLHSHKANKKDVLNQLQKSLDLARYGADVGYDAYMKLSGLYECRKTLNDYAKQVFETIEPLNLTIYEANGELARFGDYPDIIFTIPNIRSTSSDKYQRYLRVLNGFKDTIGRLSEDYDSNPWRGSSITFVSNEFRHDVGAKLPGLALRLIELAPRVDEIFESISLTFDRSYEQLQKTMELLDVAKRSPGVPYNWISDLNVESLREGISVYEEKTLSFANKFDELQEEYRTINSQGIYKLELCDIGDYNSIEKVIDAERTIAQCLGYTSELSRLCQEEEEFSLILDERKIAESKVTIIKSSIEQICKYFDKSILNGDYSVYFNSFKEAYNPVINALKEIYYPGLGAISRIGDLLPAYWIRENLGELIDNAHKCLVKREGFFQRVEELQELYGKITDLTQWTLSDVRVLMSVESLNSEIGALRSIIATDDVLSAIDSSNSLETCRKELVIAREIAEMIRSMQSDVLQNFDKGIFNIDYWELLIRYRVKYSSIIRFLRPSYYADKQQIELLYRDISKKLDYKTIITTLTTLQDIEHARNDMRERCMDLIKAFGNSFQNEDTPFDNIEAELNVYAHLVDAIRVLSIMRDIAFDFESAETELTEQFGVWYKGYDTSWENVQEALHKVGEFRQSIRMEIPKFQRYYKDCNEELTEYIVILTLRALQRYDSEREKCHTLCHRFVSIFDGMFDYENTDFAKIDAILMTYTSCRNAQSIIQSMECIVRDLQLSEAELRERYGFYYDGVATAWNEIRDALLWTRAFIDVVDKHHPNEEFVKCICSGGEIAERCASYHELLSQELKTIETDFEWYLSFFGDPSFHTQVEISQLGHRIQRCANELALLEEWIDFVNSRRLCINEGLAECAQQIEEQKIKPHQILPTFKKRFFRLWLDSVLPDYPSVMNFRRKRQERTICTFCEFDRTSFDIAKARIQSKLLNGLPSPDMFTSGLDEMGILKRELSKKRRIMPIRKLFREIPDLLLSLKPCLMMSPLSVSLFLRAETYKFDIVIFDEASQVCTENAIGAIARGKQVVIVGDSKQLPPTSFFSVSSTDSDEYDSDDDSEDDDSAAYESVLDEANLLPEKTLLWHYRSRHEHLIAFSNAKIYNNNLVTFPSNVERTQDNGVEYIYVANGTYDRGGKGGNRLEAEKVADLVFDHFSKYPNRSLGVITFGNVQQKAIETVIRSRRERDQRNEIFFKEDRKAAFFIKSLESVQGDERDTIIFSIGYAKDINGRFSMNFGPLNKFGGERRLNVAITRAKYNLKLVGSILPSEINIDSISSEGPKLLRSYIDFAMNGVRALSQEIKVSDVIQHDSPFEESVYNFLDRKGYKLSTQVGCSGYRIDIAVKHPTISGRYVLGIECDGASYHSAKTARERDRLRQDVLESMGWKIYRVWSTDWIKDMVTEGNQLIAAIEEALKNGEIDDTDSWKTDVVTKDFVSLKEKSITINDVDNPYGFDEEQDVSFERLWCESHDVSIQDCITEVVTKLYPVHFDIICKHLAPLFGNEKVTSNVKNLVNQYLSGMGKSVVCKDDFYFPSKYDSISPRINHRKIKYISPEELAEAMYRVLSKHYGMTRDSLCSQTAKAYSFNRMTGPVASAMDKSFELLLWQKRIAVVDGKVRVLK